MTTPPAERLPDLAVLFPVRAWLRHPALRAWTTWLFVALVAVPPAALVVFADADDVTAIATVFAAYFAAAWFLVLRALVRPRAVGGALLAQVVIAALVIETPLAVGLETVLAANTHYLIVERARGRPARGAREAPPGRRPRAAPPQARPGPARRAVPRRRERPGVRRRRGGHLRHRLHAAGRDARRRRRAGHRLAVRHRPRVPRALGRHRRLLRRAGRAVPDAAAGGWPWPESGSRSPPSCTG